MYQKDASGPMSVHPRAELSISSPQKWPFAPFFGSLRLLKRIVGIHPGCARCTKNDVNASLMLALPSASRAHRGAAEGEPERRAGGHGGRRRGRRAGVSPGAAAAARASGVAACK